MTDEATFFWHLIFISLVINIKFVVVVVLFGVLFCFVCKDLFLLVSQPSSLSLRIPLSFSCQSFLVLQVIKIFGNFL